MMKKFSVFVAAVGVLSVYSAPTVSIGPISPDRWSEFRDLRLSGLSASPQAFSASFDDEVVHQEQYWRSLLEEAALQRNRWIVCAESCGRLVGMACAVREWHNFSHADHLVCIEGVYVLSEFRGQGIATDLINELCRQLDADETVDQLLLWVNCMQGSAVRAYQNAGFSVVGTLKRGLKCDGVWYDNYLMERATK